MAKKRKQKKKVNRKKTRARKTKRTKKKKQAKQKVHKSKKRAKKSRAPLRRALDVITIKIPAKSKRDFQKLLRGDKDLESFKGNKKREVIFAKEAKIIGNLLNKLRTITGVSKKQKKK